MRTVRNLTLALLLVPCLASTALAEGTDWTGLWVTDEGAMTLTQSDGEVTGDYGRGGSIDAKASGDKLEGSYRIGNVGGRVEFEMQEDGNSFVGKWIRGGDSGTWRGWRKDPDGESGKAAKMGGYWLTSLGAFMLEQKGSKVEGRWRQSGWDKVKGEVKGRRFSGQLIRPTWQGEAWLEVTKDGKRLYGLTNESPPTVITGVKIENFSEKPKLKAGEIAHGISENGMLYFIRPPTGWRKGKPVDAIVLMHGSNWTTKGMVWVTAKNWPKIAKNYMIIGIQGDQWATWSEPDDLRHNYHYVNWMGKSTYKGYPYTERDSPYLVSQVVEELGKKHKWKRTFIGGHSQGGFMAYLMYMHYPELFAGAFPVAGGLVIQAEPDVFEDEKLKQAQRDTPLAIVHGKNDSVVSYDTGLYIRDRFASHDFPMMRMVDPELGHPYDFLPIGDAIDWLDAMSTEDSKALIAYGQDAAKDKRWADVGAALHRAKMIGCEKKMASAATALDAAAKKDADRFKGLIEKGEAGDWVDEFLVWKTQFGAAPAAAETREAFQALRDEHDPKAEALIGEARQAFRNGDRATGKQKYEEVLSNYFAARMYPIVKRWVEGMD